MNRAFCFSLLTLIFPLALSACAAPGVGGPVQPDFPGRRANEAGLIAASHGRAQRRGDDLILAFGNGQSHTFHTDDKGCVDGADHCDHFVLLADLPQFHWFLVFEGLYEGGRFILYDDRADVSTELPYWPVFSPDGQRILIQNDDVTSNFPGDNLEIWRRDGMRAVREWGASPDASDTGVSAGGPPYHSTVQSWRDDRISLILSVPGAYDIQTRTSAPGRSWPATLTRESDGWHLSAHAPKQ